MVLQYLRNIAKSANQIELEENIAILKGSQIWKASVQLQKYFSEFWGLHLQVQPLNADPTIKKSDCGNCLQPKVSRCLHMYFLWRQHLSPNKSENDKDSDSD